MDSGELSPRTWKDYHDSCERLIAALGRDRPVEDQAGDDFEKLRATLAKTRGAVALGNEVQRIPALLENRGAVNTTRTPVPVAIQIAEGDAQATVLDAAGQVSVRARERNCCAIPCLIG